MKIEANSVDEYIAKAPEERRDTLLRLRHVLLDHLPKGFVEELSYGMPGYVVPHTLYSPGYHCDPRLPLPFVSFASQKNFIATMANCCKGVTFKVCLIYRDCWSHFLMKPVLEA